MEFYAENFPSIYKLDLPVKINALNFLPDKRSNVTLPAII